MTEPTTVEVYLVMDEDGDYEVAKSSADALEFYRDNIGGEYSLRVIQFNITMTPPTGQEEISVTVPDAAGETVTAEVAA